MMRTILFLFCIGAVLAAVANPKKASKKCGPTSNCLRNCGCDASQMHINDLAVHEWGTFTSVQGSNGNCQAGLQWEEEALPEFVLGRQNDFGKAMEEVEVFGATKSMDWNPTESRFLQVTQKLETPVLYFYSSEETRVRVNVDFPKGIVTEVYPMMKSFTPAYKHVEMIANGTAVWDVQVAAPEDVLDVPPVAASSIWAPSRRVNANYISNTANKGDAEHLIFYRGLGQFEGNVQVTSTEHSLTVTNTAEEDIPAAFVLYSDGKKGSIRPLGPVRGMGEVATTILGDALGATPLDMELFLIRAQVLIETALVDAGLFPLEARAMVDTWSRSYFKSAGVRVLYVVPREWTDELLPTKVTPEPSIFERVMVGRVEVLLAEQETELAKLLDSIKETDTAAEITKVVGTEFAKLGRFCEPKIRAVIPQTSLTSAQVEAVMEVARTFSGKSMN